MIRQLRVTVAVDNLVRKSPLLGEHGWAVWVEADGQRVLFDTGQGRVLRPNLEALEIDVRQADALVLSHGHYDHTGGLAGMLNELSHARLYVHPAALEPKYSRGACPPHRFIGMSDRVAADIRRRSSAVVWTTAPTEIAAGLFVTGEIPRRTSFEDVGGPFHLNAGCTQPDPLIDDQAMYMETTAGLVVLLGCAHAGVVNTLDFIAKLTGRNRFHAVIGGMHLQRASPERLAQTVAALRRYQVEKVVPGHCTGGAACARLWAEFPDGWQECAAGCRLEFAASSSSTGRVRRRT
ncbi:MAG TPA: MBL fold metallo-hydrolase [Verrucomicrobiae bacterium]|nr:MBL fold metallo-hydrolase [Verrucomicrobiae bacterium]